MEFDGFRQSHFDIFAIEGYKARMPLVRAEITPRLKALGELLLPRLTTETGLELYPRVAMHMRRTVNPPEETWVAFARSPRAYKPFIHYRVSIRLEGVKVVCFVEDDADDKPAFARGLDRSSTKLAKIFKDDPGIQSFDLKDQSGHNRSGKGLDSQTLKQFANRLATVKAQHASFGYKLDRHDDAVASAESLSNRVIECAVNLLPLYRLGAST